MTLYDKIEEFLWFVTDYYGINHDAIIDELGELSVFITGSLNGTGIDETCKMYYKKGVGKDILLKFNDKLFLIIISDDRKILKIKGFK